MYHPLPAFFVSHQIKPAIDTEVKAVKRKELDYTLKGAVPYAVAAIAAVGGYRLAAPVVRRFYIKQGSPRGLLEVPLCVAGGLVVAKGVFLSVPYLPVIATVIAAAKEGLAEDIVVYNSS